VQLPGDRIEYEENTAAVRCKGYWGHDPRCLKLFRVCGHGPYGYAAVFHRHEQERSR